jgi:hypothetical protein
MSTCYYCVGAQRWLFCSQPLPPSVRLESFSARTTAALLKRAGSEHVRARGEGVFARVCVRACVCLTLPVCVLCRSKFDA